MNLTDAERLIVVLMCEIHQHLQIKDGLDAKFVQEAVLGGNAWAINHKYPGIFGENEIGGEAVIDIFDFLSMWEMLEECYDALSPEDKKRVKAAPFGTDIKFHGFDANSEAEYIRASRLIINQLGAFANFKGRDLNSHMPSVDMYRRMLSVYNPMKGSGRLSATHIIGILKEMVHPSNR